MYDCFNNGGFVVTQTRRKGSGIPMDQALEKQYNKPAKGPSGIIGFSRRKEAVCKWNIIKHEKLMFSEHLSDVCKLRDDDEYSFHHEFSNSITDTDRNAVGQMIHYIKGHGNPFNVSKNEVKNLVSGENLDLELVYFLMNCIDLGESEYKKFKDEKKTTKLFDPIAKMKKGYSTVTRYFFYAFLSRDDDNPRRVDKFRSTAWTGQTFTTHTTLNTEQNQLATKVSANN